ncbi:MAG: FKBP-type peptidyl-prolyl cis-trans isomerase [Saprospiraceae bacterium]|nr:FKBP-type peptidyl-prolyl cis-trans isomerase [Saprospiraceae bacterium]MDW8230276.1 FKBP-type peptidyl-prolyl cis-trans isomerase [Saprospiraceae bacterium]
MVVEKDKAVFVHYTLKENDANGEIIESTHGEEPLGFIYGIGQMLPDFEANLEGLKVGDTFSFTIKAANAYGERDETAIVEVPKHIFETDGVIPDGLLEVGNILPLTDQNGNHYQGIVHWVGLESVKIDFNHPMAGVDLHFTGHIESIRDAEPDELDHGHIHGDGYFDH